MSDFETAVDIANRACQHVGARRISAFTDNSLSASEINACYDKLRKAELRRNVWRFSIRKASLRPIDTDTLLLAPAAYVAITTYSVGAIVSYGGDYWEALVAATGETPGTGTSWEIYAGPLTITPYDTTVSYYAGELVYDVANVVYRSLQSSNSDAPPAATWRTLGSVSTDLDILYPVDAGPSSQTDTRNVFMLPNGFMREAPQDPKAGGSSYLGAPSGLSYTDWELEGQYLVSREQTLLVYRFAADITQVPRMDAMFCEGLGARIGMEVCETLTQSAEKLGTIAKIYSQFMSDARQVNGIETGTTEPAEDDYIQCRL